MKCSEIKQKLTPWNWTKKREKQRDKEGRKSKRRHKRQRTTSLHTQKSYRNIKLKVVIHTQVLLLKVSATTPN